MGRAEDRSTARKNFMLKRTQIVGTLLLAGIVLLILLLRYWKLPG